MVLSGLRLPSASAVSFSLCSVSLKPKERLWSKSQPILRGDDSPFPGVAALLAGTVWASEGTEASCDFELGLSQSPEPRPAPREPGSRTAAAHSLAASPSRSLPSARLPAAPQATGMRFPVPGSSSHRCSETKEEGMSRRVFSDLWPGLHAPSPS